MNPVSQTFQPNGSDIKHGANSSTKASSSSAVVTNGFVSEGTAAVDEVVEHLRCAVVDELCDLRCELDALKKGGWKVAIGPFMQQTNDTDSEREQTYQNIGQRIERRIHQTPVLSSIAAHNVLKNLVSPSSPSSKGESDFVAVESSGPWKPAHVRNLKPLVCAKLPAASNMVTFSWEFLHRMFHGAVEHSPGLWYIPLNAGGALVSGRTFYAINSTNEPFLPSAPCDHGAKMTAFFNENPPSDGGETAYSDIPLFISAGSGTKGGRPNEYIYFGNYSQTRWSDKLSYSEMHDHVPQHVKDFWAAQLTDPSRPTWVSRALMKHFFPMPEYEGVMPSATPNGSTVTDEDEKLQRKMHKDVKYYVEDLSIWESDAKKMVSLMKKDDILKAFENADADEHPGLRLWWEYLECQSWDRAFYDMLVKEQGKLNAPR